MRLGSTGWSGAFAMGPAHVGERRSVEAEVEVASGSLAVGVVLGRGGEVPEKNDLAELKSKVDCSADLPF